MSDLDRHVRRLVGIETLRRLRRIVDGETASNAVKARWAARLGFLFFGLAVIFVFGLVVTVLTR